MTFENNRVARLFNIQYPIIQAGMIWCSGWELAAAVSEAGGLGLLGSGSMYPDVLRQHIRKCKTATSKPFGVNVPLLYPSIEEHIQIILEEGIKIVFSSAGNPRTWTARLKEAGVTVVHVVPGVKFAQKAQDAGVDAVVCEGFEAGGHNGKDETTTFCLIPQVRKAVTIPVIAAGGIATGGGMLAALALGAEGVQIGSRFAASIEASAHANFKESIVKAQDGDTMLALKSVVPVRLIKNKFYAEIKAMEESCATPEQLSAHLGRGRAKKGMFEGDMDEGELEIGQIAGLIDDILPAGQIVQNIIAEYQALTNEIANGEGKFGVHN